MNIKSSNTLPSTIDASLVEPLPLHAVSVLERFHSLENNRIQILGSQSLGSLGLFISQFVRSSAAKRPVLIVVNEPKAAAEISEILRFFDPHLVSNVLPAFDVSPHSGLYPFFRIPAARVAWCSAAQTAKPGQIFVASIQALTQRTMPYRTLQKASFTLRVGQPLPENIAPRLNEIGYSASSIVEDVGHFALRGYIVDVFSPTRDQPCRIELNGDLIQTIREFDPESQASGDSLSAITIVPTREVLFSEIEPDKLVEALAKGTKGPLPPALSLDLQQKNWFPGIDFLLPFFFEKFTQPCDHFSEPLDVFWIDKAQIYQSQDEWLSELKEEELADKSVYPVPPVSQLWVGADGVSIPDESYTHDFEKLEILDSSEGISATVEYRSFELEDFRAKIQSLAKSSNELTLYIREKLTEWKASGHHLFISVSGQTQAQRLRLNLESMGFTGIIVNDYEYTWTRWIKEQADSRIIHIIPRKINTSFRLVSENFVLLTDSDFLGKRRSRQNAASTHSGFNDAKAKSLAFGELKPGDFVVHKAHGISVYEGLKVMAIQGADAEFIQLRYKDSDKLYLPVYRISQLQKYSGPQTESLLDKLGGNSWQKTQIKVRSQIQDVANELLQLYAKRAQSTRDPIPSPGPEYYSFIREFPFEETVDQQKAIDDVLKDLSSDRPMDRLVCGDVGFGKTEVALRAAFHVAIQGRQVAVIAPTTVLCFQHFETFKKRFKDWPIKIAALNRFVPDSEARETIKRLKSGDVDVLIGTHRLLSRDVEFKNLGLLVIDEEHKFGVKHKERLRQLKVSLDTLCLSATPIPRTLNLSLVGLRDLSLISTAPVNRLPTRTFVSKFEPSLIRKAILSELKRSGQVFFIHNRIQSIYALESELKQIVPEARIRVGHGQMDEDTLEKTMVDFYAHHIDILLSTTIIESGLDVPRANTMFVDQAHQMGLSQLYQLRGRVGRSQERAYCYLLVPPNVKLDKEAEERLKVIQENSALGSGVRVAQHDLELRGAGDILGAEQSGHINAVGYELYLELLEDAIHKLKGETSTLEDVDPEINLKIPALIPDSYIPDIRLRLYYYKALSEIQSQDDLTKIEDEMRDQFGKLPDVVVNLMGVMLIRQVCRTLVLKDLSSGKTSISLFFTEKTRFPTNKIVELTQRPNKKYALNPDGRLSIRMNEITWPRVLEELQYLSSMIPHNSKANPTER